MRGQQISLFGAGEPRVDASFRGVRRLELDASAWVDHVPGWVEGYDTLFAELERAMRWRSETRPMYDRVVAVPRLLASVPVDGPGHPLLDEMRAALRAHYGAEVGHASLALYRDGRDSVAWHRDRPYKDLPESLVAVVSLGGGVRRFMLRPFGGGPSHAIRVGLGDLVVMGGTCQRGFEHCVPKTRVAEPRIAIMLRWPSAEHRTSD